MTFYEALYGLLKVPYGTIGGVIMKQGKTKRYRVVILAPIWDYGCKVVLRYEKQTLTVKATNMQKAVENAGTRCAILKVVSF